MIEAILSGLFLGGALSLMVGPVFFMLIDTSLKAGMRPATLVATGVVLCDALLVAITYFSSASVQFLRNNELVIGWGGGILLMIFGLLNIFRKPHLKTKESTPAVADAVSPLLFLFKGFSMNLLNPFVLVFWLGVAGLNMATGRFGSEQIAIFYLVVLLTVFASDLLKAWLAARMKTFLKPAFMHRIHVISGIGLFAFGFRLIYKLYLE